MKNKESGITLVALIITIIVLLILAVVSIQAVTGTGLFSKTSDAVDKYQNSTEKENSIMDNHAAIIDSFLGKSGGSTGGTGAKAYGTEEYLYVIYNNKIADFDSYGIGTVYNIGYTNNFADVLGVDENTELIIQEGVDISNYRWIYNTEFDPVNDDLDDFVALLVSDNILYFTSIAIKKTNGRVEVEKVVVENNAEYFTLNTSIDLDQYIAQMQ